MKLYFSRLIEDVYTAFVFSLKKKDEISKLQVIYATIACNFLA